MRASHGVCGSRAERERHEVNLGPPRPGLQSFENRWPLCHTCLRRTQSPTAQPLGVVAHTCAFAMLIRRGSGVSVSAPRPEATSDGPR